MAIINTLREKMGKLLVVVVGLSIMAFVLTDLLSNNSSLFGGNSRNVGEIDGQEISQEQFANVVDNLKQYYGMTSSNDGTMQFIRNQAWDQLIRDIAYTKKLDQLGLEIGTNERVDMVQGKNISPVMVQFFNQFIGSTDINSIKQFLSQINAYGPEAQFYFASAEQQAMVQRRRDKFANMLSKTEYVTLAEAQQEYQKQFGFTSVDYVAVPLASVTDDQIGAISDAEVREYLNEHEDDYTVEETRSTQYVSFPVIPSASDSADYRQQMADIKANLEATTNDSTYATSVTEQGVGFTTYDPSALPLAVANNLGTLKKGDIIGPDLSNGIYTIHKISDIIPTDDEFARASQIAFNIAGKTPSEVAGVRRTANEALRKARNGESFGDLIREYSTGPNVTGSGDFGWIKKGDNRIADTESAIFSATRTGVVRRLVETANNIYVVNVNETKIKNRYKIAQVIVEMTPSFETTNNVYLEAAEFAASAYGSEEFNRVAGEKGYSVFSGTGIDKNAVSIGTVNNARQIVTWLYGEASLGDVKEFELDNEYIVAVYDEKVDAGVRNFNAVKPEIITLIRKEKKGEFIADKLSSLDGTVASMASAYGAEATVHANSSLTLNTMSLDNVGLAPEAIGAAFALQNPGDKTKAYVTDNYVVVVQLKSKSDAAEIGDYTTYENQLLQAASGLVAGALNRSIVDKVDVTDERYKFF